MRSVTASPPPARWSIVFAFALVYLSWGTTYLAIQKGVESFPPALFGGVRIGTAGIVLVGFLLARRQSLRMSGPDLLWTALVGLLLFVGGNGLITWAEMTVPSGATSVLVATTPLWIALLELVWPWGERLTWLGWMGLILGLGGVLFILTPRLQDPTAILQNTGPFIVLGSAACWAVGSFVVRHRPVRSSHLVAAAYQMIFGGMGLLLTGLVLGETTEISRDSFAPGSVYAFFHLLVFGSLVGFVAYNWLLGHVSAAKVGTYAYVNPVVALLVGWLLNGEELTVWIVGGMAVILCGVALVRGGGRKPALEVEREPTAGRDAHPANGTLCGLAPHGLRRQECRADG